MENKKDIGCEVNRYCSNCETETAQFIHDTEYEDMVIFECLCCDKKEEEIC